jgi:DNA-directed RNA polymerase subunit RPC12/RpoP
MLERRLWSKEEVGKLKLLYLSVRPFEDIIDTFPMRTANAIRQKASRLGLRRPIVSHSLLESQTVLRCTDGNGGDEEYLFKCGSCGSWIHVNLMDDVENRTIVCSKCNTTSRYVA